LRSLPGWEVRSFWVVRAAGEVRFRGEGDAALPAFEAMGGEGGVDIGIGLGDALRVAVGGLRHDEASAMAKISLRGDRTGWR
jgi:hypothetical protein